MEDPNFAKRKNTTFSREANMATEHHRSHSRRFGEERRIRGDVLVDDYPIGDSVVDYDLFPEGGHRDGVATRRRIHCHDIHLERVVSKEKNKEGNYLVGGVLCPDEAHPLRLGAAYRLVDVDPLVHRNNPDEFLFIISGRVIVTIIQEERL